VTEPAYARRFQLVEALPPGRAVAVHRAMDAGGRSVIITVVRPADAGAFEQHMIDIAEVRHLALAEMLDAGRDDAERFVVSEDVRGSDARTLVSDGPLPIAQTALMGAQAAAGLAALHGRRFAHGDVAPGTVMRADDGTVKLIGVGLAPALAPLDLRPGAPAAGARYISPEEALGRPATQASDVYRLGLVLYLLLTGTPAFDGPDADDVARKQVDGVAEPPQFRNPAVPPVLAQIVMRALDKDPARRGSAAQLQGDLEHFMDSARVEEPPPPRPRSRAWIWATAVVVVVLAALALAWAAGAFNGNEQPVAQVTVPSVIGMTQSAARGTLEQAGLRAGDVTPASASAPAGTVVTQDPAAGTSVAAGTAVALTIAAEPSPSATTPTTAAVPDVTGDASTTAQQTLLAAGFAVVLAEAQSATVPSGKVISQAPQAGVVATLGSAVHVVVSSGQSPPPSASP
jgi:eukaryotic-like serine/threonine-protein kinase